MNNQVTLSALGALNVQSALSLETLCLAQNQVADAGCQALFADGRFARLKVLNLALNKIECPVAGSCALSSLETLYLDKNQIKDQGVAELILAFNHQPRISLISLQANMICAIDLQGALALRPKTGLATGQEQPLLCSMEVEPASQAPALSLPSLSCLDLRYNSITDYCDIYLVSSSKDLELYLHCNKISKMSPSGRGKCQHNLSVANLALPQNQISDLADFLAFNYCTKIRLLQINNNQLAQLKFSGVIELPSLDALDLSSNRLNILDLINLFKHTRTEKPISLKANHNILLTGKEQPLALAEQTPLNPVLLKARAIELQNCEMSSMVFNYIINNLELDTLADLNIANNQVDTIAITPTCRLANLKSLTLVSNLLSVQSIRDLFESKLLSNLEVINVGQNFIKQEFMSAQNCLLRLKQFAASDCRLSNPILNNILGCGKNVIIMELQRNFISKFEPQLIQVPNLLTLNLSSNQLDWTAFLNLMRADNLGHLEQLNLSENAIAYKKGMGLLEGVRLLNLQYLNLKLNQHLDVLGIQQILACAPLQSLSIVNISNTSYNGEQLDIRLQNLTNLIVDDFLEFSVQQNLKVWKQELKLQYSPEKPN